MEDEWKPPQTNRSTDPQLGGKPQHPALPAPAREGRQRDPGLPHGAIRGPEPGAAPYNILKAQHILEGVMPFTEQQVAATLQEVHSLLSQWTAALLGEPIVLTDSLESTRLDQLETAGAPPNTELAPTFSTGSECPWMRHPQLRGKLRRNTECSLGGGRPHRPGLVQVPCLQKVLWRGDVALLAEG